ncbi:hypothetical protein CERZMDRAFT_118264 [Cercospora zeae-maydis SCOH1-5]|uniref:Pyrroloquinoline quinone-dependent pyranose dehydrogenase beta-propeller domain-containing protein n=1 Tax=Cercospora zeae-maydis SCOH1-5 TaxID=717836 RepID=A0A6A6FA76_9PEZI|nr:hypothetical protein CERZMDRAFT_118264 [Cercospora zeae-maydis SCOH1-5]
MRTSLASRTATFATVCAALASAQQQDCTSTISASGYPAPSLASGWRAHIIANDLEKPRSLKRDINGHLLVADQGVGITRLTLEGEAPCLTVADRQQIISNSSLNHGLELSPDNSILYASSQEAVYAWDYNPESGTVSGEARRVINLGGDGSHATRTLLLPPLNPDYLLVSWGSDGNVDPQAREPTSGYSTVRAFNISDTSRVYEYATDGIMVGWGLRNSVGLGQNPVTGGIFSNENSVDELERDGVSIVEDNPAEELNFHGYLNGTETPNLGAYYGYPDCYPAWDPAVVPNAEGLQTGQQFAANFNDTITDDWCRENSIPPVLSFTAHMAPMDLAFNSEASTLYITFRGSWNRENPAGYKLSAIPFNTETGLPSAPPTSTDGYVDIMTNEDEGNCPDNCFRPVGLEWNADGTQLFMTADASGEIYIVYPEDGSSANNFTVAASENGNGTSGSGGSEGSQGSQGGDGDSSSGESAASSVAGLRWWAAGIVGLVGAFFL